MADRKRSNRAYEDAYIGDNLARQAEYERPYYEPDYAPSEKPVARPKKKSGYEEQTDGRHKREKGLRASFGFAYTVLLVGCTMVIFFSLVKYVSLNIEATQKSREIAHLRKELSDAIMENDNYEMAINSTIDYGYIYKVATEELGMVYASKKQIVKYRHKESEYVEQYKDVE